jgi:hypothetical protein
MEIENLIRYAPRAVGLKPSAMRGEARLRGRERIISSKTIRDAAPPPYAPRAVGVNPPAMRGEARLRERERIISSKTIRDAAPPRMRLVPSG